MADEKKNNGEFQMKVRGIANGHTSYQSKKTKVFYYSGLLLVPGSEQNLKIELSDGTSPSTFEPGQVVEMFVKPRYWSGKFTGLMEA